MLNTPDPKLLHTFVTIVDCGSFTGAAKRIHRTQSAVSMQIRRLEELIGHRLFERSGRSIKLTGDVEFYGSILAPYAEVDLGGGSSYYGALVGGFVTMHGDFQFHVDESLPLAQPLWDPPPPFLVK